ncbi:hypothetical protein NIES2119_19375 [[Phormidium ambiguum] IAM M-71]|uniref:Uncharacterized protein n=1 Tax=[Phormidium ambiguum] IAM M-71 TaxID=454136 RepID=A0A1U7IFC6_9CYAN|nr:hypothetical protein NIES2119_19375 [Phormidium ambiguum IAM M-71]
MERQIVQLVQQITLSLDNPASVIHQLVFHMVGLDNHYPEKPTKNGYNFRNEFEKNYRFYQE